MLNAFDTLSLILVGALWGCTNPLLREGSAAIRRHDHYQSNTDNTESKQTSLVAPILSSISRFGKVGVWAPYLLNQCGSLLYYKLLAHTDLTLAVPICNALALIFSCVTSSALGEHLDKPLQAVFGASLVVVGVAICITSVSAPVNLENQSSDHGL